MTQGGHLAVCRAVAPVRRPGLGCSPPGRREVRPEKPLTRRLGDPGRERASAPPTLTCKRPHSPAQRRRQEKVPGRNGAITQAPVSSKLPLAKTWRTGFKHTSATSGKNVRSQHATFSCRDQTTENSASRRRLHDALRRDVCIRQSDRLSEGLARCELSS